MKTVQDIPKEIAMSRMKLVMAAAIAAVAVQLLCVHSASAASGANAANAAADDTAPKPPIKAGGPGVSPDDTAPRTAMVVQDNVAMRAAAKDSSPAQAQLWRGEALEIRGERPDHFQVYDYRRERGGFVRKSALLPLSGAAAQPASLLAALRVVRQQPGMESLGVGLAAAYVQAASVAQINGVEGAEALDAMGTLAEARRARMNARLLHTPVWRISTRLRQYVVSSGSRRSTLSRTFARHWSICSRWGGVATGSRQSTRVSASAARAFCSADATGIASTRRKASPS